MYVRPNSSLENEHMARIVLIEDDDLNRRLIAYLLRKIEGSEVVDFADGTKALDYLRSNDVDLVVLDYQLPHITGREIIEIIRSTPHLASVPVIVLTAYLMQRENFLSMGFTDYIPKPIENEKFVEGIKKYIV